MKNASVFVLAASPGVTFPMHEPVAPSSDFSPRPSTDALKSFPSEVRASFARYADSGDLAAADLVVLAILRDQMSPRAANSTTQEPGDHAGLVADLGLDSVSILDAIFLLEDVFSIRIPHEDLPALRTVGDLRAYLRRRLATPAAR